VGKPQPAAGERKRVDLNGDPLPDGAIARLGQNRRKHDGRVNALIYSPDGKILASAGDDHLIRFWDAETDRELRQLAGHESEVNCLAFSPDGKVLASGGADRTIRFWDVATGKELSRIDKHPGPVQVVAYAPDGKTLASGGDDKGGNVCVWETSNGKEVRRWKAYQDWVAALAFSPDGKRLVSAGKVGVPDPKDAAADAYAVAIWDPGTGKRLVACPSQVKAAWAVAFSPDGKFLATAGWDKEYDSTLALRDPATGKEVHRVENTVLRIEPRCIVFTPDGKTIAMGGLSEICFWDVGGAKRLEPVSIYGHGYVNRLALSPSGQTLASADEHGETHLWDMAQRKERVPGGGHRETIHTVAVSPDGKMVATVSEETVCLWNLATGRLLRQLPAEDEDVFCAAFAPDGKILALGHQGEAITFWDPTTGKMTGRISVKNDRVNSLAFAPDGKSLVSAGIDGNHLHLWDVTTRRELRKFAATEERPHHVVFSPDGRTIASTGDALFLWDAVTGKQLRRLEDRPLSLAFSPDGSLLAMDRLDSRLLEVATGQEVGRFEGADSTAMAFSPDGQFLAVLGDKEVRILDVLTGRAVRTIRGHRGGGPTCFGYSPDGKTLVTGSADCTALVWDLGDLAEKSARKPKPEQVPSLWDALNGDDRLKAYDARCRLRRAPEQALTLLQKQLRPAKSVDARHLAHLIADLDSEVFETREKATQELGELDAGAEKALRQALKDDPSAEVRRRIEGLLARIGTSREAQRTAWALKLLERLGTSEARRLLEELAKGDPESPQTKEAKACLDRLLRNGPASR
jgi:WD40 repeat protein